MSKIFINFAPDFVPKRFFAEKTSEKQVMKKNTFLHRIDKDLVNNMPIVAFEGETFVINLPEQVADAMAYLNGQKMVGVDTETRPSFVKGQHYPVALVQIATEERCYLFQLNRIGMPEELAAFFANPKVCKIGLAFKDDLNALRRRRNFEPKNCVDVQRMVGQYGILDLGLQKIFAICFGKKISKSQQLTNWENIELTPEQARYASTDAWATLLIYKELKATQPLSPRVAERLKREMLLEQQMHQQEVLAARKAAEEQAANSSLQEAQEPVHSL